jgi:hypothetical protein
MIKCPKCKTKMVFCPKNPKEPWIKFDGYGCPKCEEYYFFTPNDEKKRSKNNG